jgi:hypothetical protein
VVVDKKVAEAIDRAKKDEVLDDNAEAPIPTNDGIDHMRWSSQERALARLLVDPENDELTQEELGAKCGYSLRSVQRKLADPNFKAYVNAMIERVYDDEIMAEAKKTLLYQLRKNRNLKAVELVYKSKGMLKEVREVKSDVNVTDNRPSTNAEIDDELARLEKEALGGEVN